MMLHRIHKMVCISEKIAAIFITVFLHPGQKPGDRLHKCIVIHNAVPFIALQPVTRISIVLGKDQCMWICFFYCLTKFLPKFMIVLIASSKVCRNIQSPAVYIIRRWNPFLCDTKNILFQLFWIFIIQLWQRIVSPPAVIASIARPFILPGTME